MDWALAIASALISLLLPAWFSLVGYIPLLMVLSNYVPILPPLGSIGEADFYVHDAVLTVVAAKVGLRLFRTSKWGRLQPVHTAVGIYMGVLLCATIVAAFKFGTELMMTELVGYARFAAQVSTAVLLLYSIDAPRTVRRIDVTVLALGYVVGASIYIGAFLHHAIGLSVGEVQASGDLIRSFGPIGDQVGYLLVFFTAREAMSGRIVSTLFFVFAIMLGGTRGVTVALAVVLVATFYVGRGFSTRAGQAAAVAVVSAVMLFVLTDAGQQLLMRFTDLDMWTEGYSQRIGSMTLGVRVFLDHWLTGVGFGGFSQVVWAYEPESIFWSFSENFVSNTTNQYIQVATDAGIVGLLVFLVMAFTMIGLFGNAKRFSVPPEQNTFSAAQVWLVALLVGNQSAVWFLPGSVLSYFLWILVGVAAWWVWFARRYEIAATHMSRDSRLDQSIRWART